MLIKKWLRLFLKRVGLFEKLDLDNFKSLDIHIQDKILKNSKITFYVLDINQMKFINKNDSLKCFLSINNNPSDFSLKSLVLNDDYEYIERLFLDQGYGKILSVSYRVIDQYNSVKWVTDTGIKIKGSGIDKRIGLLKDETELNIKKTTLNCLSSQDPVTKFLNTYAFNDQLLKMIGCNQVQEFALIKIEIQNYNSIRNQVGYNNISFFDRKISGKLGNVFEKNAVLGRVETNVYCVILPLENGNIEKQVFEKCLLIQKLSIPDIFIKEHILKVNMAVGVSHYPQQGSDSQELLKKTDMVLNFLEERNESKFAIYDENMDPSREFKHVIDSQLLNAINDDKLFLEFQPVVESQSKEVSAVEIHVKWKYSSLGLMSLNNFFDLAEKTGKIRYLGKWLFKKTCQLRAAWIDRIPPNTVFSIKTSCCQFDEQYIEFVHQCLIECNLTSSLIEIEINEKQLIENYNKIFSILRALAAMDVGIVIDDFGEKYSSFWVFKKLNITKVKLHESLIFGDEEECFIYNDAVIKSFSEFCKKMNIRMIAKGVESEKQVLFVKQYDIDAFQGGYFYHPGSSNALFNIFNKPNETLKDFRKSS